MKKALLGLATAAALIVAAGAANADGYSYGSVKDLPPPAPQVNWHGLYFGVAVGYGIASTELKARAEEWDPVPPSVYELDELAVSKLDGISSKGFQGTLTLGYDRLIHPNFLIGIFGDYTFGDLKTDGSANLWLGWADFEASSRFSVKVKDSWAIGARIGLIRACCTMWYLSGGYAQADFDWKIAGAEYDGGDLVDSDYISGGKKLKGWFIGGGVEHQLHDNLFLKLDYRYTNYDKKRLASYSGPGDCCDEIVRAYLDSQTDVHTVRLGLNWKVDLFHRHQIYSEPLK